MQLQDSNSLYLFGRDDHNTEFPDNSYNFIIALEYIEHLELRIYTEIKRITKAGSKLFVASPMKKFSGYC